MPSIGRDREVTDPVEILVSELGDRAGGGIHREQIKFVAPVVHHRRVMLKRAGSDKHDLAGMRDEYRLQVIVVGRHQDPRAGTVRIGEHDSSMHSIFRCVGKGELPPVGRECRIGFTAILRAGDALHRSGSDVGLVEKAGFPTRNGKHDCGPIRVKDCWRKRRLERAGGAASSSQQQEQEQESLHGQQQHRTAVSFLCSYPLFQSVDKPGSLNSVNFVPGESESDKKFAQFRLTPVSPWNSIVDDHMEKFLPKVTGQRYYSGGVR